MSGFETQITSQHRALVAEIIEAAENGCLSAVEKANNLADEIEQMVDPSDELCELGQYLGQFAETFERAFDLLGDVREAV